MNFKISQTVPICPECQALMLRRYQNNKAYYFCWDCRLILEVIAPGKSDNEIEVTDGKENDEHRG